MATQGRTSQQRATINGPAWSRNNTSDFEPDSDSDSAASSHDEPFMPEDIDLYDPSEEFSLTDEQISALNERADDFQAAEFEEREKIVFDFFDRFKSDFSQDVDFEDLKDSISILIRQHLLSKLKLEVGDSSPGERPRQLIAQSISSQESQEIALTDRHISMLGKYLPEFRTADAINRGKMVENAATLIKRTWADDNTFDKEKVENLIRRYLYGKAKRGSKKLVFESRKWTYRGVVNAMKGPDIDAVAVKLSKDVRGSAAYLGSYNAAREEVEKKLTNEQRRKYREMAKEWTDTKPPPEVQQRMMRKHGPRVVKEFTSHAYKEFGMRVVVLAAYLDEEGDPAISFFDYNDQTGGTSFKARNDNWNKNSMVEDFSKWGAESFGFSPSDGSGDESSAKQKTPEVNLRMDSDGYPILPSYEEINLHPLIYKKRLIGKFMSEVYYISLGAGKRRVPWAQMQKAQVDFIKPKYLPKKVTLKQYYHLRESDVDAIIKHWTRRIAAGKVPFRFRDEVRGSQEDGRAAEENGLTADADMESDKEYEEDPQDCGDSNAQGEREPERDGSRNAAEDQSRRSPQSPDNAQQLVESGGAADLQAHTQGGRESEGYGGRNAAENQSRRSPQSPGNAQQLVKSSGAADLQAQKKTDRGNPQDSPWTSPRLSCTCPRPRPHPRPRPRSRPLRHHMANGSQAGPTSEASNEDAYIGSGSSRREPPPSNERQSDPSNEHSSIQGPNIAAGEDDPPLPSPPNAADNDQMPPPSLHNAAGDDSQLTLRSTSNAADGGDLSPPASRRQAHEHQQASVALQSTPQTRRRTRNNGGTAAGSPSSKRRKVDCRVDGPGPGMRRSNRDRRPTAKAATVARCVIADL